MRKPAQSSLEYVMMIALAVILILVFVRLFFDPRFGTIYKAGKLQNLIEKNASNEIERMLNEH